MDKLIYLADDDENIRNLLKTFLISEGYIVEVYEDGDALFFAYQKKPCDLVILDVLMPGSNGFAICERLRSISKVPVIMLTARDTDEDYVMGIASGSDDYLTKPFSPVKLVARVKAMFRRMEMDAAVANVIKPTITVGDVVIFPNKLKAFVGESEILLTSNEFRLLSYLALHNDKAVSRDELLTEVWGYEAEVETRVTDDTIKRLRRKLDSANSTINIETVRGYGFSISIGAI